MDIFSPERISAFSTIFLSILIEAIPFVLLGSLLSGVVEVYVEESFIKRIFDRKRRFLLPVASVLGMVFPVCECAVVPMARRLIKKGLPSSA
ncbi:MAG: permease, partial [Nitrospirae bacterium]